jgi:hypothetical protein
MEAADMNKAVDWIENHPRSPYRLDNCELWYTEFSWEGQSMRRFQGKNPRPTLGNSLMFSLKSDDDGGDSFRWRPDGFPNVYEDPWTGLHYHVEELQIIDEAAIDREGR